MRAVILQITRLHRQMRGGSQAWLVTAEDRRCYVAKFAGNPQGTRTLVNEWIATFLLHQLSVCTPQARILRFSEAVLGDERLGFTIGNHRVPIADGLHFGSLCPVNPEKVAIFDFLPPSLLQRVKNRPDFASCFVFDKWVGQQDARQAIYFRNRAGKQISLMAFFIDHGMSFGGSNWDFSGSTPRHGLPADLRVYSMFEDFRVLCEASIARIGQLTENDLQAAARTVPDEWLEKDDRQALEHMLHMLFLRRIRLWDLVARSLDDLGTVSISSG